jgi:DNA invertase Pin-like site-specific DNA recombinase
MSSNFANVGKARRNGQAEKIKVVALARVSTEKQLKLSPSVQINRIKAWAKSQGYEVIGEMSDAKSGRRADRVGLKLAMNMAIEQKAILVTYDSSRLFRNALHMLKTLEKLEEAGAAFATVTEPLMDTRTNTSFARFFRTLMGAISQLYSEQGGEKIADSNRATVKKLGHRTNGKQKAGWRLKPIIRNGEIVSYKRVRVPEEEAVIAQCLHAADSVGFHPGRWTRAAKLLNESGVPTINALREYRVGYKNGHLWTADLVRKFRLQWFDVVTYVPTKDGSRLKLLRGEKGPYKKREVVGQLTDGGEA